MTVHRSTQPTTVISATAINTQIEKQTRQYPPIIRKWISVTVLLCSSSLIYYTTHSNILSILPGLLITTNQWRAQFRYKTIWRYIGLLRLLLFVIIMCSYQVIIFSSLFELINYAFNIKINYSNYIHLMPYIILYVSYVSNTQTMSLHSWRAYTMYLLNDVPSLIIFTFFKYIHYPLNQLSSPIIPNKCYLGCVPLSMDIKTLATRDNIRGIVNLCAEYSGAIHQHSLYNIQQLYLPTIDSTSVSYDNIVTAVNWMNSMNKQNKPVFVHCKAGIARSATVACCYLISNGYTPVEALKLLQRQRPEVASSILKYENIIKYAKYHQNNNVFNAPIVVNSWPFTNATKAAWRTLNDTNDVLQSVVDGCSQSEADRDDHTVGPGGSIDENGESTLDAMVMCGRTMNVGAIANLREIDGVTRLAYDVMKHTGHSLIVGSLASEFAMKLGYKKTDLHSDFSKKSYSDWIANNKQPNYWLSDNGSKSQPKIATSVAQQQLAKQQIEYSQHNHDTIGVLALNTLHELAAACSSNGATYKIPGRVGDSPLCGSGAYADNTVGAASATGAGDIMLRFCPAYQTVEYMRAGMSPTDACINTMKRIIKYYPNFQGAIVALDRHSRHGAASYNWIFSYSVHDNDGLHIIDVPSL